MQTHLTWSIEKRELCPFCGGATKLITADLWHIDEEDGGDSVELHEEVTGHYCAPCHRLVALTLNTTVEAI